MDVADLVVELERELRAVGDEERAVGARAYLKSDLEFIGVPAKPLREVARSFIGRYPGLDRERLIKLVLALWGGCRFSSSERWRWRFSNAGRRF